METLGIWFKSLKAIIIGVRKAEIKWIVTNYSTVIAGTVRIEGSTAEQAEIKDFK